MLEICQNAAGSTDLATDRRGHDGPSWTPSSHIYQFLLLLSSFFSTASMTDCRWHNGPSRVFVSKYFNSWNLVTGITSLNFMTNLQDGPSYPRRTVTSYITPHLVRLPYIPSASSLRCHLWTVKRMTDRHQLRRWSLLHFFTQNLRIQLWTDFLHNKEKLK